MLEKIKKFFSFSKKETRLDKEIERAEAELENTELDDERYEILCERIISIKRAKTERSQLREGKLDPNVIFKGVLSLITVVAVMIFEKSGYAIVTKAWPLASRLN